MTSHELIAPKARILIPGYLNVPSWIPTLPKLGSILGFSQRLLWPLSPIAIKAKNNLLSSAHGLVESLEQSKEMVNPRLVNYFTPVAFD